MSFKIYYLDDEPDLCEIMSDRLNSVEISVETFCDSASLLKRCEESKPDLFFLDFRLPGTTGDEVAFKLDPAIPKVLITGEISPQTKYPFIAIMSKPISKDGLLYLINKIKKPA